MMNEQTQALIQVAVAYATGCATSIEQQVANAKQSGVAVRELEEVIQLVRQVRLTALMDADAIIQAAVEAELVEVGSSDTGSSCGCGSGKCC